MIVSKIVLFGVLALARVLDTSDVSLFRNEVNTVRRTKPSAYDRGKRVFDIVASLSLLLLLAPLMLFVALIIRLTSSGDVIFRQKRLTLGGRVFTLLKFRSMRADAESETGAIWASKSDPRTTAFGRFLRITRLDELPQLFNVLIGDMSLIGPRPERPELAQELAVAIPTFNRRLEVRAGITGLAQVVAGYPATRHGYRKKVALDILYIEKRSVLLDATILARTVKVVFTGFGAH